MKTFVKSALMAGAATVALGSGAALAADAKVIQNKNGSLTIYGQITRTIIAIDDGDSTRLRHANQAQSATGIDISGSTAVNKDLAVKTYIDIDLDENAQGPSNTSGGAGFGGEAGAGGNNDVDTPKAQIQLVHARMGTLTFGKAAHAVDGIAHKAAHGGYGFAPGLEGSNIGNTRYKTSDGGTTGTDIGDALSSNDCGGRAQMLRYDTPNMMGFTGALSHSDDADITASGTYSGKMGGLTVGLRAGLQFQGDTTSDDCWQTSLTLKHGSGLGFNIHYTRANEGDESISTVTTSDRENITAQLSYAAKMNEMGTTTLIAGFQRTNGNGDSSNVGELTSVGAAQDLPGGVSVYLKYLHSDLDQDTTRFASKDDIHAIEGGLRVKF
jgi:hypothetical protein